jgi:SP family facilitated glucose transporter-like MFS transporter 8
MTVVSIYLIEKAGRRILLIMSSGVMAVCLTCLGCILLLMPADTDSSKKAQGLLCIVLVLLYVAGFAVGFGAVPWVYLAEVTPAKIRSKAFSLFIQENWFWNLLISLSTLTLIEGIGGGSADAQQKKGVAWLFLIFAAIAALAFVFVVTYVKETKGKTAAEIHAVIHGEDEIARMDGEINRYEM